MSRSDAWTRFWKSTNIGYIEWHDGTGYDLDALRAMTNEELAEVVPLLLVRVQDWRDVEAYVVINTTEARTALRDALRAPSADTRLHAAQALYDLGEPIALDRFVATELTSVTFEDGMTTALRIANRVPTAEVRRVLLEGARDRPDVAYHFAASLLLLVKHVDLATIGGDSRRFLLRFGAHSSAQDRQAAFDRLCELLDTQAKPRAHGRVRCSMSVGVAAAFAPPPPVPCPGSAPPSRPFRALVQPRGSTS